MRIDKITLRGFTTFKEEQILSLEALGPGLIAFAGPNGAGKTTLLESIPGGIYRTSPSRGNVADLAISRDAQIELVGENGSPFTVRLDVDSHNGKSEAVLIDGNGEPLAGPKVRDFDRAIAEKFPPLNVYLAAAFACQTGAGSLLRMDRADRRDLFGKLLGLDHLEDLATLARKRAADIESKMISDKAALEAIISNAGNVLHLQDRVIEARAAVDGAKDQKDAAATRFKEASAELDRMKSAADDAVRSNQAVIKALEDKLETSRRALDAARQAKAKAQARAAAASDNLARLDRRLIEVRAILGHGDEIRENSKKLEKNQANLEKNRTAGEAAAAEERRLADETAKAERKEYEAAQALTKASNDLYAASMKESWAKDEIIKAEKSTGSVPCAGALDDDARGACPALQGHFRAKAEAEKTLAQLKEEIPQLEKAVDAAKTANDEAGKKVAAAKASAAEAKTKAEQFRDEYRFLIGQFNELKSKDRSAELSKAEAELSALKPQLEDAGRTVIGAQNDTKETESVFRSAEREVDQFEKDLEATRGKAIDANGPEYEKARGAVLTAEREDQEAGIRLQDAEKALAVKDSEFSAALEAQKKADEIRAGLAPLEKDAADYRFLARGLGREGVQALELDAAGPQVSTLANELLADAYGSRFQIRFETHAAKSDGKGVKETFDIVVVDNERGREGSGEDLSGGEKVIVGEALGLAVGLFHAQSAGVSLGTVVRDETVGALDPENAERYLSMLRAFLRVGKVHQLLFVAHSPALVDLADAVVRVDNGKIIVK